MGKETVPAKQYEPTERERAAVDANRDRRRTLHPWPGIKIDVKGPPEGEDGPTSTVVSWDHDDPETAQYVIMETIGAADPWFMQRIVSRAVEMAQNQGVADPATVNFYLSVIADVQPQNETQAMLALQMAAAHECAMIAARRYRGSDSIQQSDANERAMNKLMRTFTTQAEAMKRLQAKAQQTVRVEKVYVSEGGNAIVGNVHHTGGGPHQKNEDQAHELTRHAERPALRSDEPPGQTVPLPGNAGKEAVQASRGQGDRRSKG